MPPVRQCILALGSNLGNRLANLQDALRRLSPEVEVQRVSALYETEPVGPAGQVTYFNAVCAGTTSLEPAALLTHVKAIEWAMGRRPGVRWGPRPLDLDILLVEGVQLETPLLTIPHPRIEERGFVLVPLMDAAPDVALPSGRTVADAAQAIADSGVIRIAGPEWVTARSVGPAGVRPDLGAL